MAPPQVLLLLLLVSLLGVDAKWTAHGYERPRHLPMGALDKPMGKLKSIKWSSFGSVSRPRTHPLSYYTRSTKKSCACKSKNKQIFFN
ncbi:hypothetical protein QR680_018234 [Steinernema hermaphroditum]|uniref:Uncharacterized protein n=1 Tax=Steinernema hermaphroditum TaxID=289476 RepID=A0AA39HJH8_9BILA|nr:hypothetical protein QR680_018234 [Steinernema hermaphroditum]